MLKCLSYRLKHFNLEMTGIIFSPTAYNTTYSTDPTISQPYSSSTSNLITTSRHISPTNCYMNQHIPFFI